MGKHRLAQGFEIGRVAEHFADLHRQIAQQPRQHRRVVQDSVLQRGQRRIAHLVAGLH